MNKFLSAITNDSHLGAKLVLSFGLLISIVVCLGLVGLKYVRADAELEEIIDARWHRVELSRNALNLSNLNNRITMQVFLIADENEINSLLSQRAKNTEETSTLVATLRSKIESPEEAQLLDAIEKNRTPYLESYQRALHLLMVDKKPVEARAVMAQEALPRLLRYHSGWNAYVDYQGNQLDQAQNAASANHFTTRVEASSLISLAILLAIAIAFFVTRNMTRHMARRKLAEEALRQAHPELEIEVREHTPQLAGTNEELQKEIDARKLIEHELRASEERYRQIVDSAQDMIFRVSPVGHFTFVNPAAAATVKRSVAECEGLHFLSLIRKDFRESAIQFYQQQVREKIPVTYFEFPVIAKDGTEVWVGQNVQLEIEDGEVVELQAVGRDITTRKEIEERLLESEHRYRLLFESNPLPVWVYDLETLAFLAVNNAAIDHYGYSREEFLAMTISDIRPPKDVPALVDTVAKLIGESDNTGKWRHRKKDGSIIDVEITSHTLEFAGGPARIVLAVDITERKRAKEALEVRAHQQAVVAEIGQLALADTELPTLMDKVVALVAQALDADYCKILELLPGGDELLLRAGVGWKEGLVGKATVSTGVDSQAGFTLLSNDPVIVEDLRSETRFQGPPLLREHGVVSGLSVIIQGPEHPFGVLGVHTKRKRIFTRDDTHFLQAAANVLTEAIQRKRSEQALRESEEKYRTILENIEDGYFEVDIAGNLTFFNDAMCKILSYSRDELMGMNNREYTDKENSRKLYETFNRVYRTAEPARAFDWQIIRKDGGVRFVEASVSLIKDSSGRRTGFRGIVHDITERKRAEEELKESQQWLAAVYDSSRDGIVVEESERIVYVNQSYAHLFGYEPGELIGQPVSLVCEQEPSQCMLEYSRRRVRGEEAPSLYEFRGTQKDGMTVDLEASVSTAKIAAKTYIIALCRDITERKRAQEKITQLAEIVASSHDGMVRSSADGIVMNWNKGAERIYGYSAEEIVGSPLSLLVPDDRQDELPAAVERLKRGESIDNHETKRLRKDGTLIDVSLTLSPVTDSSGELTAISAIIRDITEHKRAESEILLQKARFQQLFENAPLGILRVDQNDIVLDANREFEDIFQFSLDEMRGRPINEIVVPKAHREEGATLSSSSLQGESIDHESVRQRKDGTLIPVHIYGVPVVVNQKPVGVFAIYVDLSERKRLEEERQAVFEIIQGAISTSDLGDLFKLIHESISSLIYAENCFVALHDPKTDLMHFEFWVDKLDPCPPPLPVGIGFASYVLRTGKSLLLDRELTERMYQSGEVEKSGSASASWLGVPLRTHSRTIGVLVVQHYEDEHIYNQSDLEFLTSVGSQIALSIERKQAEHALQEANKRALTEYERLIERIASLGQTLGNARDLTIIFRALRDFAGASVPCDGLVVSLYEREKQTRRVVYCWTDNEELNLKKVIEVPVGEGIAGKAISSGTVIVDNNFKPLVGAKGKPVLLGKRADNGIPRSALIAPMTVMGRTVGCVEVQSHQFSAYVQEHATAMRMAANLAANAVENVTLIKREQAKEEQLRQAQKMESIGTLAGGIAHDFNNLMTAVTCYSDLALRSLTVDNPLRPKIEEIKKAGERATALTRQLLAFSRKQILQPKVLDLNTVVTGMAQMLPRLIGEHIDLRFRLGDSLGQIKADVGQIEQVLMNLAVNARDAMPEGGVLTIKTENVHLTGKVGRRDLSVAPGVYVLMDVSDTGSGMDTETQSHIFEPFFTTKGVGKGTGLGLSTVYGIVKQSGGSVWVYSEVGKGTTFKIYLPRVDVLVESAEIVCETEDASRGHETVLLVEDEDVVRNLSKEILETYGYFVLVASNGREGLRVGKEFQGAIDLVITDVIMPQMSGREMAEGLRTIRPDTRVLFMSGFTDDDIVHHGVLDERVFFIQKPFSPEALATKAREVLDQAASI